MIAFKNELGSTEYWYDASDVAKFLTIKVDGKILGRNKFLQYLRFNKLILKDSNQPTQLWITLGLAKYHAVSKNWKTVAMPLWSDKGLNRLKNMLASGSLQNGYEKKITRHLSINDVC